MPYHNGKWWSENTIIFPDKQEIMFKIPNMTILLLYTKIRDIISSRYNIHKPIFEIYFLDKLLEMDETETIKDYCLDGKKLLVKNIRSKN